MRYTRIEERRSMFRGNELPRLMGMLVMLAVLFMMIQRARDPGMWKWLEDDVRGRPSHGKLPPNRRRSPQQAAKATQEKGRRP